MENQLLEHLLIHMSKMATEHSQKDYDNFERADKIVIWIVGFSIGIFVLLLGKEIDKSLPLPCNSIIIISLIIIIFGLTYRILSFFTTMLMSKILVSFVSDIEISANIKNILSSDQNASQNIECQINEYKKTISLYFGINEKQLNEDNTKKTRSTGKRYRNLLYTSYTMFFLTIGLFIVETLYVLYSFITT
ncbi:hypothetical protein GR160_00505 [Flavobacterium sp. Sd200]|uniref:hypothetical protein n=1 Tax=Flavobacterium sp. Sd200 TaxID=2692211 RepID=UPI00136C050D|nr:hypothetical protein [Flavobacterium sp. Sd200]MXN89694.1 hypothetical protein [Flavobacterium sp. Sd200]